MPLAVISFDDSMETIRDENSFTIGELMSHPLAAGYVPKFDAFQDKWFAVHKARTLLEIAVAKAEGAIHGADAGLDDFIDTLDKTVLLIVKNDRKAPLYLFFFGAKPPHQLKRPVLSDELVTCRGYIPSLQGSAHASLVALAPILTGLVAAADAAVAQKIAAEQALKQFDEIGDKKSLVDDFNGLRKSTHGELGALPHQNPSAQLPADFAERFFRHESHTGLTSLTNAKDVQAKIDRLKKSLSAAEAHMASLDAKAEAKAAKKKREAEADAALAQARIEEAAAREKVREAEKAAKDAKHEPPPVPEGAPAPAPVPPTPPKG